MWSFLKHIRYFSFFPLSFSFSLAKWKSIEPQYVHTFRPLYLSNFVFFFLSAFIIDDGEISFIFCLGLLKALTTIDRWSSAENWAPFTRSNICVLNPNPNLYLLWTDTLNIKVLIEYRVYRKIEWETEKKEDRIKIDFLDFPRNNDKQLYKLNVFNPILPRGTNWLLTI